MGCLIKFSSVSVESALTRREGTGCFPQSLKRTDFVEAFADLMGHQVPCLEQVLKTGATEYFGTLSMVANRI